MNGFRQAKENTKSKIRGMEVELQNTQAATRVSQLLLRQIIESNKKSVDQIASLTHIISELQYKVLAFQRIANIDLKEVAAIAEELRLKDFDEASDAEDKEKGYTVCDVVDENSVVIITSTTSGTDTDAGIFRSKFKLADCGVPTLINELKGKTVGATVKAKLNNVDHEVTLLGIRYAPPAQQNVADNVVSLTQ